VLLLAGVHQTAAPIADAEPELWRRYLALVFDGIRARDAETLPTLWIGWSSSMRLTIRSARPW
jgi:hypothetical protein